MKEVYLVYYGSGGNCGDGYDESEYVRAIYASRDLAIKHINNWKKNWDERLLADSSWKLKDDDNDWDVIDSDLLIEYRFVHESNTVYAESFCYVTKMEVLDEFKES